MTPQTSAQKARSSCQLGGNTEAHRQCWDHGSPALANLARSSPGTDVPDAGDDPSNGEEARTGGDQDD